MAWELGSWGPWRCQIHRGAGSNCHRRSGPVQVFPSFWQLCPDEDCSRRWHSCLDHRNSDSAKCAGTPAPLAAELWSRWSLFLASGSWHSDGLSGWSFSVTWSISGMDRTLPGVLLCFLAHQALKGPPCLGSFSVAGHVRGLKGHFLWGLFSCLVLTRVFGWWGRGVGGGYRDGSPPVCDSAALPCLLVCLSFLQKHFPLQSPSGPLGRLSSVNSRACPGIAPQSLCSSPASLPSRGPIILSRVLKAVASIF